MAHQEPENFQDAKDERGHIEELVSKGNEGLANKFTHNFLLGDGSSQEGSGTLEYTQAKRLLRCIEIDNYFTVNLSAGKFNLSTRINCDKFIECLEKLSRYAATLLKSVDNRPPNWKIIDKKNAIYRDHIAWTLDHRVVFELLNYHEETLGDLERFRFVLEEVSPEQQRTIQSIITDIYILKVFITRYNVVGQAPTKPVLEDNPEKTFQIIDKDCHICGDPAIYYNCNSVDCRDQEWCEGCNKKWHVDHATRRGHQYKRAAGNRLARSKSREKAPPPLPKRPDPQQQRARINNVSVARPASTPAAGRQSKPLPVAGHQPVSQPVGRRQSTPLPVAGRQSATPHVAGCQPGLPPIAGRKPAAPPVDSIPRKLPPGQSNQPRPAPDVKFPNNPVPPQRPVKLQTIRPPGEVSQPAAGVNQSQNRLGVARPAVKNTAVAPQQPAAQSTPQKNVKFVNGMKQIHTRIKQEMNEVQAQDLIKDINTFMANHKDEMTTAQLTHMINLRKKLSEKCQSGEFDDYDNYSDALEVLSPAESNPQHSMSSTTETKPSTNQTTTPQRQLAPTSKTQSSPVPSNPTPALSNPTPALSNPTPAPSNPTPAKQHMISNRIQSPVPRAVSPQSSIRQTRPQHPVPNHNQRAVPGPQMRAPAPAKQTAAPLKPNEKMDLFGPLRIIAEASQKFRMAEINLFLSFGIPLKQLVQFLNLKYNNFIKLCIKKMGELRPDVRATVDEIRDAIVQIGVEDSDSIKKQKFQLVCERVITNRDLVVDELYNMYNIQSEIFTREDINLLYEENQTNRDDTQISINKLILAPLTEAVNSDYCDHYYTQFEECLQFASDRCNGAVERAIMISGVFKFSPDRAVAAIQLMDELDDSENYRFNEKKVLYAISPLICPQIDGCFETALNFLSHQCYECGENFINDKMTDFSCHETDVGEYCKTCAQKVFIKQLEKFKSIEVIKCPICGTPNLDDQPATLAYFDQLLTMLKSIHLPTDKIEEFKDIFETSKIKTHSRFVCCAKEDCQSPFYVEATTKRATCPSCNLAQCLGCSQEWNSDHENMSCEDYTDLLNEKTAYGTLVAVVTQSVSQEDADKTLSQENACLKYIESDDVPREQKLLLLKFYPFTFTSSTFELEEMRAELVLGILDDLSSKNDYECKISDVIIAVSSQTSPQFANCWENAWKYLSHLCLCCYNRHPASKMASFLCHDDGDNGYCKDCAKNSFLSSLQNKMEIGCIKCPICEAPDLKQPSAVFEYFVNLIQITFTNIGMCEQDKARFDIRMREMNLHEDSSVHQCVRCQTHYYGHGEITRITCTVCQTEQCYICEVKWEEEHKGKTCEQYQKHLADAKEATATNEYIAEMDKLFCPQPNCNRMVNFIRGGCQHVKCLNSKCEFEFCAGCGEEHSRDRYRHARNCFCRMRDLDRDCLMKFLVKNGKCVDPNVDTVAGCTVPVENENGKEEICQKPVFKVAYCRAHYKSWLIKKINDEQLETAKLVFSEDNLHPLAQYLDAKGFKYATANVGAGEVEVPTARDIKDYNAMIDICINEIPLSNLSGRPLFHLVEHEETAL